MATCNCMGPPGNCACMRKSQSNFDCTIQRCIYCFAEPKDCNCFRAHQQKYDLRGFDNPPCDSLYNHIKPNPLMIDGYQAQVGERYHFEITDEPIVLTVPSSDLGRATYLLVNGNPLNKYVSFWHNKKEVSELRYKIIRAVKKRVRNNIKTAKKSIQRKQRLEQQTR